MANKKSTKSIKRQFIEYIAAGGAFFWSGYAAFALFDAVFGWPLFIAKQLANLVGLSVNYVLVDRWVFKEQNRKMLQARRTGRYVAITIVNFGIDYLIVSSLKELGITPYIGQFASAGFFTLWNFVWYKYWVFAPHTIKEKPHNANKR